MSISGYKTIITMFTVVLVIIIPLALFSPAIFSGISFFLISEFAFYSSVISFVLGIMFFIAAILLTEENKKRVVAARFETGMEAMILCIPYIIYLAIKQLVTK
ncbi:hypothetical protein GCM10009133_15030 [Cocleimonas flava]|uniref:Uncharacterized protein n=1 Tax=Cocleimonas flava TaxID=634765 RepID=A0A4R1FAL0_9GAMM|nr:hypothetical protein [Cocleimonas flava]TCJ87871.1 hypothetical protein EV695_2387 [Cocleimonas flava]